MKPLVLFALLIPFVLTSCAGYQLGSGLRAIPGGYDRIAIPVFENKTIEVGLEPYFTDALRTEFIRNRTARLTSVEDAQVILEGVIVNFGMGPGSQVQQTPGNANENNKDVTSNRPAMHGSSTNPLPFYVDFARTYSVSVSVQIIARRISDNKAIWEGSFSKNTSILAPLLTTYTNGISNSGPIYLQSSKHIEVAKMARDMMNQAHDQITEKF